MLRTLTLAAAPAVLAMSSAAIAQQQSATPKPVTRAELVARLDAGFKEIDANHDGSLSTSELQAIQTKELQAAQAQTRAKAMAEFKQLDTNKDGKLSPEEFAAVASVKANQTPAQMLQNLDTNKDGKVSADEFKAPRLAVFNKVDANHDGTITPEELQRAGGQK